jgi:protein involved in polysaccharide export with SLBB domain
MKQIFLLFCLLFLFKSTLLAQSEGIQIGSNLNQSRTVPQGAFYDYSDPQTVNIKVAVWGWVKFPGKYIVPSYSNVNDLLSYAGGPTDAAHLENLKLVRTNKDSTQTLTDILYKDIMMNPTKGEMDKAPALYPGDVLLVTGEPRLYFKDFLTITVAVISAAVSLATLIYLIVRK